MSCQKGSQLLMMSLTAQVLFNHRFGFRHLIQYFLEQTEHLTENRVKS